MDISDEMDRAIAGRADWKRSAPEEWRTEQDAGRIVGVVRAAAGALEARVLREPTGPSPGPHPEQAHGPEVFEDATAAVRYVDANLGRDVT